MSVVVALVGGALVTVAGLGIAWPFLAGRPSTSTLAGRGTAMALAALAAAATLLAAVGLREEPSGAELGRSTPLEPVTYFEERVAERPDDPTARLDLADAYLEADRSEQAIEEYVAALELDPDLPEAHARLGLILAASGRYEEGLRAVDRALELRPGYPEALYARGLILAQGLDRPRAAADSLRSYLDAAPFGAYREQAMRLLERLEGG